MVLYGVGCLIVFNAFIDLVIMMENYGERVKMEVFSVERKGMWACLFWYLVVYI